MTLHEKTVKNVSWTNFNYKTKTDTSIGADKKTTKYHEFRYDETVSFDNTTSKRLQYTPFQ